MSSKSPRKGRRGRPRKCKDNDSNEDSQVFVLPPELLEKLGINLCAIQDDGEGSSSHSKHKEKRKAKKPLYNNNPNESPQKNLKNTKEIENSPLKIEETSMLETANLMKQSVFLSPTFISEVCTRSTSSSSEKSKVKKTICNGNSKESPQKKVKCVKEIENTISQTEETSMLETANLMKQSVFLSPTFIPEISATSTVNAEIEFSCPIKEQNKNTDLISMSHSAEDNTKENNEISSDSADLLQPTQCGKTERKKRKERNSKKTFRNDSVNNTNNNDGINLNICESDLKYLEPKHSFKDEKVVINQISDLQNINVENACFGREEVSTVKTLNSENNELPIPNKISEEFQVISEGEATVNIGGGIFASEIDQITNTPFTSDGQITCQYTNEIAENDNKDQNLEPVPSIQQYDKNCPSSNDITTPEQCNSHISDDDHLDEAYMSDCSNSNIGPGLILDIVNNLAESAFDEVVTDVENKVNILSEEIIDETRFNELVQNTLFSPKRDLVPVSINDIVKLNQKYCTYESDFDSNASQNSTVIYSNTEEVPENHIANTTSFVVTPEMINNAEDMVLQDMYFSHSECKINDEIDAADKQVLIEFIDETGIVIEQPADYTPSHETVPKERFVEIDSKFNYVNNDVNVVCNEKSEAHCTNKSIEEEKVVDINMESNQHHHTDYRSNTHGTTQKNIQTIKPQQSNINAENFKIDAVDLLVKNKENESENSNIEKTLVDPVHIDVKNNENFSSQLNKGESHCQHDVTHDLVNELKLKDDYKMMDSVENEVKVLPSVTKCLPAVENTDEREKQGSEVLFKINKVMPAIENESGKEKEQSDNKNTDQLQEIAFYLEKCAHILTKRRKSNTRLHNRKYKKTTEKKIRNIVKSNCNEEGVEKPGGVQTENKKWNETVTKEQHNIKTYSRSLKRPRTVTIYSCATESNNDELKANLLNVTNKAEDTTSQEFCLCNDFGRITPAMDFRAMDLHIHFQDKMSIGFNDIFTELDYVEYIEKSLALEFDTNVKTSVTLSESNSGTCWNATGNQILNIESDNGDTTELRQISENPGSSKEKRPPTQNAEVIMGDDSEIHKTNQDKMNPVEVEIASISTPSSQATLSDNFEVGLAEEQSKNEVPGCSTSKPISLNIHVDAKTNTQKMKRKKSDVVENTNLVIESSRRNLNYLCGACHESVESTKWLEHVESHNYIAWKDGDPPLDPKRDGDVRDHLERILQQYGWLKCIKCGLKETKLTVFIKHVKKCKSTDSPVVVRKSESKPPRLSSDSDDVPLAKRARKSVIPIERGGDVDNDTAQTTQLSSESVNETNNEKPKAKKRGRPRKIVNESEQNGDVIPCSNNIEAKEKDDNEHEIVDESPKVKKRGRPKKIPDESIENNDVNKSSEKHFNEDEHDKSQRTTRLSTASKDETVNETPKVRKRGRPKSKPLNESEDCVSPNEDDHDKQTKSRRTSRLSTISKDETDNETPKAKKRSRKSHQPKENNDNIVGNTSEPIKTVEKPNVLECGVCHKEMNKIEWIDHIMTEHNYLAWKAGKKPLDLEDSTVVQDHLIAISHRKNGLKCHKCGMIRKYPKAYLQHVQNCDGKFLNTSSVALNTSVADDSIEIKPEAVDANSVVCGVCGDVIKRTKWHEHAMSKHYNIAWVVGGVPFDQRNPFAAERALKEYKQRYKAFVCKVCGAGRASAVGFYAHILVCGKTEEEVDKFKDTCDVCNQKYLCIYRQQHMMVHREKELSIERRKLQQELAEKAALEANEPPPDPSGRRRAAQKARTVIENYNNEKGQYQFNCQTCEYATDVQLEMEDHICRGLSSDDEVCPDSNEEETDDSEVDSGLSEREQDLEEAVRKKKKKKKKSCDPGSRYKGLQVPFKIRDPQSYIRQSDTDFIQLHYTTERLFPEWTQCTYAPVPEDEIANYMPLLKESCKLKIEKYEWETLKTFEAKSGSKVTRLFTGCVPHQLAWAPPRYLTPHAAADSNYLAIACHRGTDLPRYAADSCHEHADTVQLWDFGTFSGVPKLSYIIAHDHGVVWSMAWCPSGARDGSATDTNETEQQESPANDDPEALNRPDGITDKPMEAPGDSLSDKTEEATNKQKSEDPKEHARLGLLAVACSNGRAYIYSVPDPATMPVIDKLFYKLKPVAELRLHSNNNEEARQCSSIAWSSQKGHNIISTGYTDGTVALFNLASKSPLATSEEDGVTVYYPYHDERAHSNCVTGVSIFPSADTTADVGVLFSASLTGASLVAAGRAGGSVGRGVPGAAAFQPHWPAAMMPDDALSISEFDWLGGSRRLGASRLLAGCARCGLLASSQPPVLRTFTAHPVCKEITKTNYLLIDMVPLSGKKKTKANTETEMQVEPLDYNEAVAQYGLQVNFMKRREVLSSLSEPRPERFPLSDVLGLAFCPAVRLHHALAAATHAGLVLLTHAA